MKHHQTLWRGLSILLSLVLCLSLLPATARAAGTTYTVSFNANGGSVTPASAQTGADGKLSSLPTPTREGYTFDGWYTAKTGGEKITTNYGFSADTTIYAQWTGGEHTHSYGSEWKSDADNHWHECSCGEKIDVVKHTPVTSVTPATFTQEGTIETKCSVCGRVTKKELIPSIKTVKLSQTVYVYDGKTKTPRLTVKDSKGKTIASRYYTVKKATGRKNVGQYTYKLTFKGNYKGNKTLTFVINPKGTKISKLLPLTKGFTVKWAKQTKQTTGYQIQFSLKPNMKGAKIVTISKNTTLAYNVQKLQANKKYYVQIRTYKTVKNKKYYSEWSKVGTVKTKK